jgi:hypothetical protein
MVGGMDGWKSHSKDCLQQSKSNGIVLLVTVSLFGTLHLIWTNEIGTHVHSIPTGCKAELVISLFVVLEACSSNPGVERTNYSFSALIARCRTKGLLTLEKDCYGCL